MVRTILSEVTTAQFLYLAATPHRRTPDPSSRPSDPFLHLEDRESTLDPRNEKTASSLDPPTEGREVKRAGGGLKFSSYKRFLVVQKFINFCFVCES